MRNRIITGLVLASIALWGLLGVSPVCFDAGVLVIVALCANEWCQFINHTSLFMRLLYISFVLAITALSMKFFIELLWVSLIFWFYVIYKLGTYKPNKKKINVFEVYLMGILVIAPLWISLSWLHRNNPLILIMIILVIAVADSGAYFVGRFFGKTFLASNLSPKKTYEGLVGGLILGGLSGTVYAWFLEKQLYYFILLSVISFLIVIVALIGDIFESMIKRNSGIKDSGKILPGHGGLLDRFDSLFAAIPIFAFLAYYIGFTH